MLTLERVGNAIKYKSNNLGEVELVKKSLTFYQEGAEFSQLYQQDKWDGYVRFYDKKNNTFQMGMLDIVEKNLNDHKVGYVIKNLSQDFKPSLPFNETLYDHQKKALEQFFKYQHGIVKVPTRGGKTIMSAEAIRLLSNEYKGLITLFIVDSILLFEQAIKDLRSYLKLKTKDIGYIKEGNIMIEEITVATIQSITAILNAEKRIKTLQLSPKNKNKLPVDEFKAKLKIARKEVVLLKEYFNVVDFLIVDECHEYGNIKRVNIIKKIQYTTFKLFMSATPFKSEKIFHNLNLRTVSGLQIYEIPEKELKDKGILAKDKVLLIWMDHNKNKNIDVDDKSNYQDYLRKTITLNQQRNNVIVNITNMCRRMSLKTLVLFAFKEHGNYIQSITGDTFLTGEDDLKYKQQTKNTFLKRKGGVLLASNIFNKGITLPEVEVLYNAGGGLEQSNVIQKKGRVLGLKGMKKRALIIDLIDNYKYFNEHSLSRIQVYERTVGIDDIEIFDADDIDFYRDVKEFLKNWFQV